MSKPDTYPVANSARGTRQKQTNQPQEPMSGSKRVKNENHSRHNNGEG